MLALAGLSCLRNGLVYSIWLDVPDDGLPQGSTVKPDRIIRSLTELVPSE